MMVPRSYLHQSAPLTSSIEKTERVDDPLVMRQNPGKKTSGMEMASRSGKPAWLSSAPPASASKPMVIPTRTRYGGERKPKGTTPRKRETSVDKKDAHDSEAVSSSMAAWLAMTSQPNPQYSPALSRSRRSKSGSRNKRGEAMDADDARHALSASDFQSWSVLLSPPSDRELEKSSFTGETTHNAASFVRSVSNDSMPSLDTDYGSSPSISDVSTPRIVPRADRGRKPKEPSSSITEECLLDHPLLPPSPTDVSDGDVPGPGTLNLCTSPRSPIKPKSSFKSNLTASLAAFRSAARSFSDFVSRDDYLTRSLLSMTPPFTDERRPLPSRDIPDPALRRYLNPRNDVSAELHLHHDFSPPQQSRTRCTASIQLQTYERVPQPSSKASAPPIFASASSANEAITAAADEPYSTPSPRSREIRENSDFLRVIVLEMNMRRSGRLDGASPGRAKMWLPARQDGKGGEQELEDGVPKRWLGQT